VKLEQPPEQALIKPLVALPPPKVVLRSSLGLSPLSYWEGVAVIPQLPILAEASLDDRSLRPHEGHVWAALPSVRSNLP
jgi:hypothetical protein